MRLLRKTRPRPERARQKARLIVLGHRGAPSFAPENTMQSFAQAIAVGADGFEFDVRLSADGKLVIVHDPRIGRLSVSKASFDQLRETPRGSRLPLLEDALREFGQAWLDIELKVAGVEERVLELAERYCRRGNYVLTSFSRPVVARLRDLDSNVPLGWLLDRPVRPAMWRDLRLDFLAPHHTVLRRPLVKAALNDGLRLIAWTVNSPRLIRRAVDLGASVIISDFPDLARAYLKSYTQSPTRS